MVECGLQLHQLYVVESCVATLWGAQWVWEGSSHNTNPHILKRNCGECLSLEVHLTWTKLTGTSPWLFPKLVYSVNELISVVYFFFTIFALPLCLLFICAISLLMVTCLFCSNDCPPSPKANVVKMTPSSACDLYPLGLVTVYTLGHTYTSCMSLYQIIFLY